MTESIKILVENIREYDSLTHEIYNLESKSYDLKQERNQTIKSMAELMNIKSDSDDLVIRSAYRNIGMFVVDNELDQFLKEKS